MTKIPYFHTVYFTVLALFIFGALSVFNAKAQTPESTVATKATTTTSQTSSLSEIEPWFEVEKLNGNVQQGDFVIGPGRIEVEVKPGETVTEYISVSNRISDNRKFELVIEDISGSSESDQAVVLMGDSRGPFTLRNYISFPENTFELDLGERARIPVTITIPPNAEPGGLYGSVLVSTVRADESADEDIAARSPIIARIGTLFFVTVPGDIKKEGETKEITLLNDKHWYEKGPIKFNILYQNTGSLHLNPYGELRIKNLFGEEVGFLELEPWFSLPDSLRTRDVTWDREFLFGRYSATANINRGYDDIVDEVSVVFWVLPWKIVGGIFLVVFIILFGIRTFFRSFEFKRRS